MNISHPNALSTSTPVSDKVLPGRILVAGVARNVGKTIKADIRRLLSALGPSENLRWLVIESDSSDNTLDELRALATEIPGFAFVSLGHLRQQLPARTQRIAHCRNEYLKQIRTNPSYRDIDYVVIADLDGTNTLVSREAFVSCWTRDDWDVCAANQRGPYYDIWALRHKVWCPADCLQQYGFLVRHNVHPEQALFAAIHSKMIRIAEDADWMEVDSAFGGLAIYRREAIENGEYRGLDDAGEEVCEHTTFHASLVRNGRRIFINPRFINAGYTEHSKELRLIPKLKRQRRNLIEHVKRIFAR